MQTIVPIIFGILLLAGGLVILIFSLRSLTTDDVSRRLDTYVSEMGIRPRRLRTSASVRRAELSGSFMARAVLPAFRYIGRILGSLGPNRVMQDLDRQLTIAGKPLGLGPREYFGISLGFTAIGFWLVYLVLREAITQQSMVLSIIIVIVTTYLPRAWLRRRVRARQEKIRRGLADALDMLSVCANAGLGFDQSLQRVSEYWKTPIAEEFRRTVSEMGLGVSRQDSLRNMADRLDITELSSFVAVILQSDQLGMSIADTLHSQADQMRVERRYRAQEQARKIPLKMLFPMLFFILPAIFAVVLGPALPILVDLFAQLTAQIR
jgi:tight adherence protein C